MTTQTFSYPDNPPLECDLIMKGGITSGVIYPLALCELAQTYRLRAIGGTSAGAIGAAVGAAAEYGRAKQPDSTTKVGFRVLEDLPRWLTAKDYGKRSNLFGLFQPERSTAPLFRIIQAGLNKKGVRRYLSIASAAVAACWLGAIVGLVPGVVVVIAASTESGLPRAIGFVAGVILMLVGMAVGVTVAVLRRIGSGAVPNNYGLCNGMPGHRSKGPALTPWLSEKIQEAAGLGNEEPLTFGHLKAGPPGWAHGDEPALTLAIMTTNLSQGRPMRMPWVENTFYYDRQEFLDYFPPEIVAWMDEHPPGAPSALDDAETAVAKWERLKSGPEGHRLALIRAQEPRFRPFPDPDNVPVIVAARMSLSFPVLLSAIHLWSADPDHKDNKQAAEAHKAWHKQNRQPTTADIEQAASYVPSLRYEEMWFSDGGICSNFPVHFFDRPLARRPTFAMNLGGFPGGKDKSDNQAKNVYLPTNKNGGASWRWHNVAKPGPVGLFDFVHSIVDTASSWVDEISLGMPGYRDRIVNVYHTHEEGGMNLDMDHATVDDLAKRGRAAAVKLVKQFAGPDPGHQPAEGWEKHRWVRFRTATAGFQDWLEGYRARFEEDPTPYQHAYKEYVGIDASLEPPSYRWTCEQKLNANAQVQALLDMSKNWGTDTVNFGTKSPQPRPKLRLTRDT
jgi:predicted acylesterase/phospholipase RssA